VTPVATRMQRLVCVRALFVVLALFGMADLVNLTLETLPDAWRGALTLLHQRQPARGGGGDAAWTLAEDAMLLHRRCNPDVKRQPWTNLQIGDRHTGKAAEHRFNRKLKREVVDKSTPWEQKPLTMQVAAADLESWLNISHGSSLRADIRRSLVHLHAAPPKVAPKCPWSIQEDAVLLVGRLNRLPSCHIDIAGRSNSSKRNRICYLAPRIDGLLSAFHHATCDADAPALELDYHTWTSIPAYRVFNTTCWTCTQHVGSYEDRPDPHTCTTAHRPTRTAPCPHAGTTHP
jgi:hypothetical protein